MEYLDFWILDFLILFFLVFCFLWGGFEVGWVDGYDFVFYIGFVVDYQFVQFGVGQFDGCVGFGIFKLNSCYNYFLCLIG